MVEVSSEDGDSKPVRKPKSPFLCFEVAERMEPIILDTAEVIKCKAEILKMHSIMDEKSADLYQPPKSKEDLWRQKIGSDKPTKSL